MKQIALSISNEFVKRKIISAEDIDIYRYGLEILLSSTLTSISVIIVATILDSLGFGLLYLFLTVPLRITVGGYHANTYRECILLSNLSYAALSFALTYLEKGNIPVHLWLTLLYSSALYIFIKAPVQNIHQPLNELLLRNNKYISRTFLILDCSIISFLEIILPSSKIVHFSILSIVLVALLIIPTQKGGGDQ